MIDRLGKFGGRGVYFHSAAICVGGKSKLKPAQVARMLKLKSEVIDPIKFESLLKEVLNWGSIV